MLQKTKILVIDNYDSFTYNLVQYLQILGVELQVIYNNQLSLSEIKKLKFSHLLISPGPGNPQNSGISLDLIDYYHNKLPILGVCLGHQCIAEYFGGQIIRAKKVMHGKCSNIQHNGKGIFKNIPNNFRATRYHSLVVDFDSFPEELEVTSVVLDEKSTVMSLQHKKYPIFGVQFHPEAILSQYGMDMLGNFLR